MRYRRVRWSQISAVGLAVAAAVVCGSSQAHANTQGPEAVYSISSVQHSVTASFAMPTVSCPPGDGQFATVFDFRTPTSLVTASGDALCTSGSLSYSVHATEQFMNGPVQQQSAPVGAQPGDVIKLTFTDTSAGLVKIAITDVSAGDLGLSMQGSCPGCAPWAASVGVQEALTNGALPVAFTPIHWWAAKVDGGTLAASNPTAMDQYHGDVSGITTSSIGANGTTFTNTYTWPAGAVHISSPRWLPRATYGTPYHATLQAAGGTPPYSWSLAAGAPAWLHINSSTGALSGTPTSAGTYVIEPQVTDSYNPPVTAAAPDYLISQSTVAPTSFGFVSQGDPIQNPHVAFLLVGDWWCPLVGTTQTAPCNGTQRHYTCTQGFSSCNQETHAMLNALDDLVTRDYNDSTVASGGVSQDGYDRGLAALTGSEGGAVGAGMTFRPFNGGLFAGPVPVAAADDSSLQHTLNSRASGWGIGSQADVGNTVFVALYPPSMTSDGCQTNGSANGETGPGGTNLYGNFVFARVYLQDLNYTSVACNKPGFKRISATQFATFAASHEIDEAIASPGNQSGVLATWAGNTEQIADPCNTMSRDGTVAWDTGPFWNLTRDRLGTVVAAYADPLTNNCFPTVDSGVPAP
jgi:hypothetical protein